MKIGITERGDAALDLSWSNKIDNINGAIIISKGFNNEFMNALLNHKDKIIYHSTITGLGNSILEPYVIPYKDQFNNIQKLINAGFPQNHIVIRIDPIIDNDLYLSIFKEDNYLKLLLDIIVNAVNLKIYRFRYSFLDFYPHVIKRLELINLKENINFHKNFIYFQNKVNMYFENIQKELKNKNIDIKFESCAELNTPKKFQSGCISKKDFEILNLDQNFCYGSSHQRLGCLCPACKTELLTNKCRCNHKCVYCYWKD